MPTDGVGGVDTREPRPLQRDEFRWRHDHQVLIHGSQRESALLTAAAIEGGTYPTVPSCWAAYEVRWCFYAESPRAALLWGFALAASPYSAGEIPRERGGSSATV